MSTARSTARPFACVNIAFTGDTPRIGVPLPQSINILTVQNSQPVVLNQNVTVTERLELNSDLTTGSFILTMPAEAVSIGTSGSREGTADVVGNVRRTGIINQIASSFGNPHTTIGFDTGIAPTDVTINLTKNAPADLKRAIERTYDISPVATTARPNYTATLRLRYLDSELNGNSESAMQLFHSNGTWTAVTATNRNTEENWLEAGGVNSFSPWTMANLAPTAAAATIGGRVTTLKGRGAGKVFVDLTSADGAIHTIQTNPFGYFRCPDVPAGETYVVQIRSKRFNFAPATQVRKLPGSNFCRGLV